MRYSLVELEEMLNETRAKDAAVKRRSRENERGEKGPRETSRRVDFVNPDRTTSRLQGRASALAVTQRA